MTAPAFIDSTHIVSDTVIDPLGNLLIVINFWYYKKFVLPTVSGYELHQVPIKNTIAGQKAFTTIVEKILSTANEDDYFTIKSKVLKAEILISRAKKIDFVRAEKLLMEVIKKPLTYKDLIARAKLGLADIVKHPKAAKFLKEVHEIEGLDPYLVKKAGIIEKALKAKARPVNHVKTRKRKKK